MLDRLPAPVDHTGPPPLPRRFAELAVLLHQRQQQPVRAVVGVEAVESLGAEPTAVHPISLEPPYPDDTAALHADVQSAAVGTEDAAAADPFVRLLVEVLIDAR